MIMVGPTPKNRVKYPDALFCVRANDKSDYSNEGGQEETTLADVRKWLQATKKEEERGISQIE